MWPQWWAAGECKVVRVIMEEEGKGRAHGALQQQTELP